MGTGTPVTEDEIITPEKMNLKLESSPDNALRGILGVASGWGTDPTNLANATDGDIDTVTGTGNKIMAGAGTCGYIKFDLGSVKTALVGGKIAIWSTAGTIYMYIDQSVDDITWYLSGQPVLGRVVADENIAPPPPVLVTMRYFRLRFYVNAASTIYAKIYEVMAWELTP